MNPIAALALLPLIWTSVPLLSNPDPVEITEWQVPWEDSRPRDPFVDAQGRVWFVGQRSHYVAYLEPLTGEFKRFDLEAGAGPHNVIVAPDGTPWYTGNAASHIGKLDPKTGKITKYPMPDAAARDPHTLIAHPSGDLWFTVQGGNFVGKLNPSSGKVDLVKVPTERSRPYGIAIDSRGRVWFNEFGSNKLAAVDPATMKLSEYALPDAAARGRRIAVTSDDAVWYVDYARGHLARFDPKTQKVTEWASPGGARSQPYAMTADDRDRVWYVESGVSPNRLVGFDPKTQQFFSVTPIQSGGGTVRHMVFHRPTREIWFGTDTNTIGRARVPS